MAVSGFKTIKQLEEAILVTWVIPVGFRSSKQQGSHEGKLYFWAVLGWLWALMGVSMRFMVVNKNIG
jgi:hypothetical protein